MKTALLSLILMIGYADRIERQLSQVQKELEQMFRTALLDGGSHELTPDSIEVLKEIGVLFKAAPFREIRVAGHGDKASVSDLPSRYFEKLALSKARATRTVRALQGTGSDSQSFIIEWYGDIRPIATNETEEGRQLNRRIEIVLYAGV